MSLPYENATSGERALGEILALEARAVIGARDEQRAAELYLDWIGYGSEHAFDVLVATAIDVLPQFRDRVVEVAS